MTRAMIVDATWGREIRWTPGVRAAILDALDLLHVHGGRVGRERWLARRDWLGEDDAAARRAWEAMSTRLRRCGLAVGGTVIDLRPALEWLRYAVAQLDMWLDEQDEDERERGAA